MSYTSRYSSSYSSRYTDSGRDPSSRYGGYSSRYSTETYDTSEDVDVDKKLAEDEVDSSKGYSSSRYGKYSSRYTSATDETGSDDYTGKRESKYSSSYRSKDTNLQLATEDVEQYGGDEEDTAIQEVRILK
ncbi:hypothetical protein TELCIR_05499 [Teladorsagia circumcincta]|uniref:Uncharacterized protein n=1 Tax=Teladorsagia circumcincta TaxID=45464 RepID=A0A2G9UQP1_TELCI|nr:hypothetical protein TELCIR_05499 [Teladorsagia circumcincta]